MLINNAGYATKGSEVNEKIARDTIGVNYFGVKKTTFGLLDLVKKTKGRIVVVSSGAGHLASNYSDEIKEKLLAAHSLESLDQIAEQFFELVSEEKLMGHGFPPSTYKVSKALVNAFVQFLQKQEPELFVASACPGYVSFFFFI